MSIAPEHFEMAAKVFTGISRPIDGLICERFAEILARESQGHSVVLQENVDLRKELQALSTVPETMTIAEELARK